jgi:PUA domain protein
MPREITIHQRHLLKSKDIREFIQTLKTIYPEEFVDKMITPKSSVEWIKIDNDEQLYAIDKVLTLWLTEGKYIPLLSFMLNHPLEFKNVKVDKGAIPYVSNGADVMRPGIIYIDQSIQEGDVVTIMDSVHEKVLAIGLALFDAETMQNMPKGKVIKTVHALNDSIWQFSKTFK